MKDAVELVTNDEPETNAKVDVSIVILTYNPSYASLKLTVRMAIMQEGISKEIIICDDGSEKDPSDIVKSIFEEYNFNNYHIVLAEHNQGIVENCLAGLKASRGRYTMLTSPGDILFDSMTMHDFYEFCISHHTKVCFGNAVYYNLNQGKVCLHSVVNRPQFPSMFSESYSIEDKKVSFFLNNQILGALFFREREYAIHCFESISDYSVYMEDHPTAILSLLEGEGIQYYNRNIIWYEFQAGVSSGKNLKWIKLLRKDYDGILQHFRELYPTCKELAYFMNLYYSSNRKLAYMKNAFQYPHLFAKDLKARRMKKRMTEVSDLLNHQLQGFIDESRVQGNM